MGQGGGTSLARPGDDIDLLEDGESLTPRSYSPTLYVGGEYPRLLAYHPETIASEKSLLAQGMKKTRVHQIVNVRPFGLDRLILAVTERGTWQSRHFLYNCSEGRIETTFRKHHTMRPFGLTAVHNSNTVVSGAGDIFRKNERELYVWDATTGKRTSQLPDPPKLMESILNLRHSPTSVYVAGYSELVRYDLTKLCVADRFVASSKPSEVCGGISRGFSGGFMRNYVGQLKSLAAIPEDRVICAACDSNNVILYDERNPTDIASAVPLCDSTKSVGTAPDLHLLAVGVTGGRISIFDSRMMLARKNPREGTSMANHRHSVRHFQAHQPPKNSTYFYVNEIVRVGPSAFVSASEQSSLSRWDILSTKGSSEYSVSERTVRNEEIRMVNTPGANLASCLLPGYEDLTVLSEEVGKEDEAERLEFCLGGDAVAGSSVCFRVVVSVGGDEDEPRMTEDLFLPKSFSFCAVVLRERKEMEQEEQEEESSCSHELAEILPQENDFGEDWAEGGDGLKWDEDEWT